MQKAVAAHGANPSVALDFVLFNASCTQVPSIWRITLLGGASKPTSLLFLSTTRSAPLPFAPFVPFVLFVLLAPFAAPGAGCTGAPGVPAVP